MQIHIRSENTGDVSAISQITETAFRQSPHASQTEHLIVNALRQRGKLSISLVAEANRKIVGHVAISPVSIAPPAPDWYGLGPVSVLPDHQGQGIGTHLIHAALAQLKTIGGQGCVVLGEPRYYSRFGFAVQPGLALPDVPQEYFQALALQGSIPQGQVHYDDAFDVTA